MLKNSIAQDPNHHHHEKSQWQTMKNLLPYLWPAGRFDLRVRVVLALIALILALLVNVITPFFFQYATDELTKAGGQEAAVAATAFFFILAYGVGRIMMVVFSQIRDAVFAKVGQRAVRDISVQTFRHMHDLSLRFHLERRTGGMARVISRGTLGIDTILRFSLFNTLPTILQIVFVIIVVTQAVGIIYGIVISLTVISYVWFTYVATEWRIKIRKDMNEADNDANTKTVDSLLNFETVKYFGNEAHEIARFDQSLEKFEAASIRTWVSLAGLNTGQNIIFTLGLTSVMAMAAWQILQGHASVGVFVMINAQMIQLYMPLNFIGSSYREIRQGLIDVESMLTLLAAPIDIKDKLDAGTLLVSEGEISFDNVSFGYDKDRPILKGISFRVPAGKTLAIVGSSGAGKSTISRLLYRFYDPCSGAIAIDGQDITHVTQKSLRHAIGMVPQDTVLFNDTIGYNIRYGKPSANDEELIQAAQSAQIHNFVMSLPHKYDTMVGERGLKLSGGEKQRIAIARTILKSPPILILDEATSALDSFTEQEIQMALNAIAKDRTSLVIAHRLSTIVDADEIIVLDKGVIAERGAHHELLAKKGLYASLWSRQRKVEQARKKLAAIEEKTSHSI